MIGNGKGNAQFYFTTMNLHDSAFDIPSILCRTSTISQKQVNYISHCSKIADAMKSKQDGTTIVGKPHPLLLSQ